MIAKTIGMALVFLTALFVIGWGGIKVWHLIRREIDDDRRSIRDETEDFRDAEYSLDRAIRRAGKRKGN